MGIKGLVHQTQYDFATSLPYSPLEEGSDEVSILEVAKSKLINFEAFDLLRLMIRDTKDIIMAINIPGTSHTTMVRFGLGF
jgi:hypothetical protein